MLSLQPVGRTVELRTLRARMSDVGTSALGRLLEMGRGRPPRRHWHQSSLGTSLTPEKSNTGSTSRTNPEPSPLPPAPAEAQAPLLRPALPRLPPHSGGVLPRGTEASGF